MNHRAEVFTARHFETTVEVYCPTLDEQKAILGEQYIRHCPMCGDEIEVERGDAP